MQFPCSSKRAVSTAFAHLALGAISFWALMQYYVRDEKGDWCFGLCGFMVIFLQGMIGVWRFGKPETQPKFVKMFAQYTILAVCYGPALFCVDLYIGLGYLAEIGLLHLGLPLCAIIPYFTKGKENKELLDMVIFITDISMASVTLVNCSYMGLLAAVVHSFAHFVITRKGKTWDQPSLDIYNYAMCVYTFLMAQVLIGQGQYLGLGVDCVLTACMKRPKGNPKFCFKCGK